MQLPMVLIFHGGGGASDGMVRTSGMDSAADRNGFVAVYPAGTGPIEGKLLTWNVGECCGYAADNECGDCLADFFRDLGLPVPRKTWSCPPVPEAVAGWAKQNRCSPETAVTRQQGKVRCDTYQGCAAGADVTLCTVDGGGHTWPGGSYAPAVCRTRPEGAFCRRWKEGVGEINRDIDANRAMWDFFRRHRLAPAGD